ncbi:MAG: redoxin domain-containing protein [Paramuribaculum sp.]|nr:redoxin domain-containing protein [Paramuribaculum sp.]
MKHISLYITSLATAALILASCSRTPEWKVKGTVHGAESDQMIMEASNGFGWYPLDTIMIGSDGAFEYSREAAGHPDIYRLSFNDQHIYLPIDSIESLTLTTNASTFSIDYKLSGSTSAEIITNVDHKLMESAATKGALYTVSDSTLKRQLAQLMLQEPSGIVAYYIINKRIGGLPVFDPENRKDLRIIGAVANAYDRDRPNDPRTEFIKKIYMLHRASMPYSSQADTIQAGTVAFPELKLWDNKGNLHDLHKVAADNKVVILNFTAYTAKESPVINMEFNKIYEQYSQKGLEIYQVAIDDDEYQWKQSASNLPWITVYSPSTEPQNLLQFNVRALPTTFIIVNGDLIDRADQIADLPVKLAKYI